MALFQEQTAEDPGRLFEQPVLSAREFEKLSRFIYDTCGIRMPGMKKMMLEARLRKRLRSLDMTEFRSYCDYLFTDEGLERELVHMLDVVTTNKTDFFREPDHFAYLSATVLPEWRAREHRRPLQVWSAGCSSGEEPYTLAMVLSEFACANDGFDFHILATDISTRMLEKARKGIYDEGHAEPIPLHLKKRYLLRSKDRSSGLVRVVPELRQKVIFRRLNFMDGDFGLREPLDIIFCRNVIIYFDRATQHKLLQHFHRVMRPGAFIFMGHSETLSGLDVPLASVYPTVYRKLK